MGNTVTGSEGRSGGKKKVKVMKIDGEFFKLNAPVKAIDVTKDYPGHILLDSKEFLRYNLRGSQPLEPESNLLPGHIYLLVQLPEFPAVRTSLDNINSSTLPRTRSSGGESSNRSNLSKLYRRSVSDLAVAGDVESSGALRVKLKLPKVEVERIMEQSVDKAEVARRIFGLSSRMDDAGNRDEGRQQRQLEAVARLW